MIKANTPTVDKMKKKILISYVLLVLVLNLGCASQTGNTNETSTSSPAQSSSSNAKAESYFREGILLIQSTGAKDGGGIILLCSPDSWNQPITKFEKALQLNPNYEEAKEYLVTCWIQKGNAFHMCCLGKILNICGGLCNCDTQADMQKSYSNALSCYNKAIEVDPKSIDAWISKGDLFSFYGGYSEAIVCYDNVLAIDPKNKEALNAKGESFYGLKRYYEAISYYDQVITIDPKDADAWYNKGNALFQLGRYSEANECFDKAKQFRDNE